MAHRRQVLSLIAIVSKPVIAILETLLAKHFLGEPTYRPHVLFRRGHAGKLRLCYGRNANRAKAPPVGVIFLPGGISGCDRRGRRRRYSR